MKRSPTTKHVKARALTDPKPAFVSLVKAGANQRPFRTIKSVAPEASEADAIPKEKTMSKGISAREGFDIVSLRFTGAAFATEEAVRSWLTEGGYSDYALKAVDGGFEVENTNAQFEEGSVEKVDGAVDGVTAFVGKLAKPEEVEKTEEETTAEAATANASAVQPVAITGTKGTSEADETKTDDRAPEDNAEKTGEIEDAMKGVELTLKGMYETSQLYDVLRTLRWMVEDAEYTDLTDEDVAAIRAHASGLIVVLGSAMSSTLSALEAAFRANLQKDSGNITADKIADVPVTADKIANGSLNVDNPAVGTVPAEKINQTPAAPAEEGSDATTEAKADKPDWQVAVDALTAQVAKLAEVVTAKSAASEEVETTTEADEAKRAAQETPAQSRKGSSVLDQDKLEASETEAKQKAEQAAAARRLRSALGVQTHDRAWS
ncbi:hypothetical protein [Paracoccus sp. MKU1]|uniref:hypothetical protein n=1 Tax=Paracoccus sp. MKU1 TaxID=1745182 RepID=UPI000719420B|nr:hypothetical protein [Paracoccus sp. MKU1]KRW94349.1 hypothetical protein AQY21_20685 [Paracoccus sp. MKU1]